MTNISCEIRNYFKLEFLLKRSHNSVRQLFKNRYSQFNGGQLWNDTTICGTNYFNNVVQKNKKINLTSVQRTSIQNGNSNEWDLSTLTNLLLNGDRPIILNTSEIQQLNQEDKFVEQLRNIRNNIAHHPSKSFDNNEFNQLWIDLTAILVALGDNSIEIDKLKDNRIFEPPIQSINKSNVEEASQLNSLGTQAHKADKFSDAISYFTKATVLSGIADCDRAVFFSNMALSRLALYEQKTDLIERCKINDPKDERYRALQDAKQARTLYFAWWKGHMRIGQVYAALNEHERAINSFEQALALDPAHKDKIIKDLSKSREIYSRQQVQEHLYPNRRPMSMTEQFNDIQMKSGASPEQIRAIQRLREEMDPTALDVMKGYQYEHGDVDVKQDYKEAARYFTKAAEQGNAEGMYNLARLTNSGLGVERDPILAHKLYEQTAEQPPEHPKLEGQRNFGVAEAEHDLGFQYAEGIVVHKNFPIAAYWYERAVAHGCIQSANNLALMYKDGIGVANNLVKAEELFEIAARSGESIAMQNLAMILLNRNESEMAKIWYDRACEAGDVICQTTRLTFEKMLQKKQQTMDQCSPDILKSSEACPEKKTVYKKLTDHIFMIMKY
ncbi:hypothetical protein I4U23_021931 [Adineta vaga]|nr:hypothetical protein I4U23_021931 [Adineta vaga]